MCMTLVLQKMQLPPGTSWNGNKAEFVDEVSTERHHRSTFAKFLIVLECPTSDEALSAKFELSSIQRRAHPTPSSSNLSFH